MKTTHLCVVTMPPVPCDTKQDLLVSSLGGIDGGLLGLDYEGKNPQARYKQISTKPYPIIHVIYIVEL